MGGGGGVDLMIHLSLAIQSAIILFFLNTWEMDTLEKEGSIDLISRTNM